MHDNHHSFDVDTTQPRLGSLLLYGFALMVVFFGSVIVLIQVFRETTEAQIYKKQLSVVSPELLAQRAEEDEKLNNYAWVDKQKGVVRIPIEQAMRLVAEEGHK